MPCNGCGQKNSMTLADFTKGAVKIVQSEIGIGIASDEVVASRRKTCESCDQWNHGRCMKCGCFTYAKTRLTNERCPLGRWSEP